MNCGPGTNSMDHHRAHQDGDHRSTGVQAQRRYEGGHGPPLLASLRDGYALRWRPCRNATESLAIPLFHRIGHEGGYARAGPGRVPMAETDSRAPQVGICSPSIPRGWEAATEGDLARAPAGCTARPTLLRISATPNKPHTRGQQVHSFGQFEECRTCSGAGRCSVDTHQADCHADHTPWPAPERRGRRTGWRRRSGRAA